MKNIVKISALWLVICAALYGMGAFITWNPNPAEWPAAGRAVLAWLWLAAAPLAVLFGMGQEEWTI